MFIQTPLNAYSVLDHVLDPEEIKIEYNSGVSLEVQRSRVCASNSGARFRSLVGGTRVPHAAQSSQKCFLKKKEDSVTLLKGKKPT